MNKHDSLRPRLKPAVSQCSDLMLAGALADNGACFGFGAPDLDGALHGGLPIAAVHEVQAADAGDYANAATFAILLAVRAGEDKAPLFWISERQQTKKRGCLYPPGLPEIGVDADRILYADSPDMLTALRVAADAVRSSSLSAIILSAGGRRPKGLDLTATRRLSLFARESAVPVILLRDQLSDMASSAWSRWEVRAAPSHVLPANAPGHPVFNVKLIRHRGGKEGLSALLEWNREENRFQGHIGAVPAISILREDFAEARKRA